MTAAAGAREELADVVAIRPARERGLDGFMCLHCDRIQHPGHLVGAGGAVVACKSDCRI
jgi:hypothetical protein